MTLIAPYIIAHVIESKDYEETRKKTKSKSDIRPNGKYMQMLNNLIKKIEFLLYNICILLCYVLGVCWFPSAAGLDWYFHAW